MKKTILLPILALTIAIILSLPAAELSRNVNDFVVVFTNSTSITFTNTATVTNSQDTARTVYHTFQVYSTTVGTNAITATLDKTIDGSNWVPVSTNVVTSNSIAEYTAVGKWTQFRWRVTAGATNATVTELYMGQ